MSRQVLYWFETELTPEFFLPERFPIFIRCAEDTADSFYGFPTLSTVSGVIKIAGEQHKEYTDPDSINRDVSAEEITSMFERVSKHLKISEKCSNAMVCMYTETPDCDFVIDRLPENPEVILVSPCSGHGFKHSAGVGEIVKELIENDSSTIDISEFSLSRFEA